MVNCQSVKTASMWKPSFFPGTPKPYSNDALGKSADFIHASYNAHRPAIDGTVKCCRLSGLGGFPETPIHGCPFFFAICAGAFPLFPVPQTHTRPRPMAPVAVQPPPEIEGTARAGLCLRPTPSQGGPQDRAKLRTVF